MTPFQTGCCLIEKCEQTCSTTSVLSPLTSHPYVEKVRTFPTSLFMQTLMSLHDTSVAWSQVKAELSKNALKETDQSQQKLAVAPRGVLSHQEQKLRKLSHLGEREQRNDEEEQEKRTAPRVERETANPESSLLCSVNFSHLETKAPPLLRYQNRKRHRLRLVLWFYANVSPFHDFTSSGAWPNIPENLLYKGGFKLWLRIIVRSRNWFLLVSTTKKKKKKKKECVCFCRLCCICSWRKCITLKSTLVSL